MVHKKQDVLEKDSPENKNNYVVLFLISCALICLFLIFYLRQAPIASYEISAKTNPYEISPLSAQIVINSLEPGNVIVKVLGEQPLVHPAQEFTNSRNVEVLGLYPGRKNKVELSLNFTDYTVVDTVEIITEHLPDYFPDIQIDKISRKKMEPGLHFCDASFAQNGKFHTRPLFFDDQGEIRWFMDLSFFDLILYPIQRLRDGTILAAGKNSIFEYDMLGQLHKNKLFDKNIWIHHEVIELPNGHLLLAIGKGDMKVVLGGKEVHSQMDIIVEYDRKSEKYLKEWDLAKVLDVSRNDLNHKIGGVGNWLHMNGLEYNPKDSTIIVSGKHPGSSSGRLG